MLASMFAGTDSKQKPISTKKTHSKALENHQHCTGTWCKKTEQKAEITYNQARVQTDVV